MARGDSGALVGCILDADVELARVEPLGKEVGGHVRVVYLVDVDLAARDALLEHMVAAQEVACASLLERVSSLSICSANDSSAGAPLAGAAEGATWVAGCWG